MTGWGTMDRINRMDRMLNEMEAAILIGKSHFGLYPVHPVNSWGKHSRIEPQSGAPSIARHGGSDNGQDQQDGQDVE